MSRQSLKKILRKPDEFFSFFSNIFNYCSSHISAVFWFLGSLVVLGAGITAWSYLASQRNTEAANKFDEILKAYPSIYAQKSNSGETTEELLKKFENFQNEYSSTSVAKIAMLYQANLNMKLAKWETALNLYRKVEKKLGKPFSYMAYEGEAEALVGLKRLDEAEKIFRYLSEANDNPMQSTHYWRLGQVLEEKGDKSEAIKAYQDLIAKFPTNAKANQAKSKVSVLQLK